jgi:hypothetical protein
MKTYQGLISTLPENGIFVFGSNTEGRHGMGSAKKAREQFGAIYGKAVGRQGRSYAIVTKDLRARIHPSVGKDEIKKQIALLYKYATENQELDFYVAYQGRGKNLNGYLNEEMAQMFVVGEIPKNIVFESGFYELIKLFENR